MSGSKMVITGGRGMFAADMARLASARGYEVVALGREDLDVTRPEQIKKAFEGLAPDYVVHTVGLLVDECETQPERARRVHVWATGCVARQCQAAGATLVNLSTCGLFGDERRFYSEYDPVRLKTEYARTKYTAEQAATTHCERTYNIRPGWMFGGTPLHKKNFVFQRYLEAKDRPVVKSADDKFGSPSYSADIAQKLLELLDLKEYGLYHVSNRGGGSRFEYVRRILKAFGLHTPVEPVPSSYFPRPAETPDSEMLENLNLRFLEIPSLPPWEEAVDRYVKELREAL